MTDRQRIVKIAKALHQVAVVTERSDEEPVKWDDLSPEHKREYLKLARALRNLWNALDS